MLVENTLLAADFQIQLMTRLELLAHVHLIGREMQQEYFRNQLRHPCASNNQGPHASCHVQNKRTKSWQDDNPGLQCDCLGGSNQKLPSAAPMQVLDQCKAGMHAITPCVCRL